MVRLASRPLTGLLSLLAVLLPGCFGGGGGSSSVVPTAARFEIFRCSLGCSGGTCAVNEIATNQDISITFNDLVDPATVHFGSILIIERTTGTTPPGTFSVSGARVTFRPALIETAGAVSFGFAAGSDYEIRVLADPESSVVRSRIGRPNTTPIACIVRTIGVIDQVPGRPTVQVTPNSTEPPLENPFDVTLVFDDLMQKALLVDPVTQQSPTISIVIEDVTQGIVVDLPVPGSFSAVLDPESLTTTVVFVPAANYPGNARVGATPRRRLRVDLSVNILDLAGNPLANTTSVFIPLFDSTPTPGSFLEPFNSQTQEDANGSTAGLWASPPGWLDSGLDPATGRSHGGGPGILGAFSPTGNVNFITDAAGGGVLFPADQTLIGQDVLVTDGAFFFEEVIIPGNVIITASGSNPLRIFARGQINIAGLVDLSGESADTRVLIAHAPLASHPGKWSDSRELIQGTILNGQWPLLEPNGGFAVNTVGGLAGIGDVTGGSGGAGGDGWFNFTGGIDDYFDETAPGFKNNGQAAPRTRYTDYIVADRVNGNSGEGVGGRPSAGRPIDNPDDIEADWLAGAGMGSWAWPPVAQYVDTDPSFPGLGMGTDWEIQANFVDSIGLFERHAIHRSRGGGGGGYWSDGEDGWALKPGSTNPAGEDLVAIEQVPESDPVAHVWEFNSLFDFNERRTTGGPVPDAAGGHFVPPVAAWATLDPHLGYLLGGAGGGGGGCDQHGSWDDFARNDPNADGTLHTFRSCTGAGGGAGGGAGQFQAGGRMAVSGSIRARGGAGGDSRFMVDLPNEIIVRKGGPGVAGGGGGSGGALLVQVSGDLQIGTDTVQVEGGAGGLGDAGNHGGRGGSGVVRFETRDGTESLPVLQSLVEPDEAVDLAPVGSPGVPNVAPLQALIQDPDGDFGPFNGNSSGVRSLWFEPPSVDLVFLSFDEVIVEVEYFDGTTLTSRTYRANSTLGDFPVPGTDPIWIALQTGWGLPPGPGQPSFPEASSLSSWIIPGYNGINTGLDLAQALNARLARLIRWQLVFDQDLVSALIGPDPSAYFRVKRFEILWTGE